MSNNFDPSSNPLNIQTIQKIDNLDLPIMQKHHVRILAHCLQILKIINIDNSFEYQNKNLSPKKLVSIQLINFQVFFKCKLIFFFF